MPICSQIVSFGRLQVLIQHQAVLRALARSTSTLSSSAGRMLLNRNLTAQCAPSSPVRQACHVRPLTRSITRSSSRSSVARLQGYRPLSSLVVPAAAAVSGELAGVTIKSLAIRCILSEAWYNITCYISTYQSANSPSNCGCWFALVACDRLAAKAFMGLMSTSSSYHSKRSHACHTQQALSQTTDQPSLPCT